MCSDIRCDDTVAGHRMLSALAVGNLIFIKAFRIFCVPLVLSGLLRGQLEPAVQPTVEIQCDRLAA